MIKSLIKKVQKKDDISRIYLDYASLTPVDPQVLREIEKFSSASYANPSSFYKEGANAKNALNDGRARVAGFLRAHPLEIVFTSGGTESNNLALTGTIESLHEKGVEYSAMHVIVSVIEHSSIRECVNYLSGKGVVIDTVSVDNSGIISMEELKRKLRKNTVIVSIMTVNNEIGSIQPIREIAKTIRHFRSTNPTGFDFQDFQYPILHTDASQAGLYEDLNVEKLGVDLLTLDGTKVCGPRGVGILYIKKDTPILPIIYGGGQEGNRRSGTENISAIMGLAKALDIAFGEREKEVVRIAELKRYFIEQLMGLQSGIMVNGTLHKSDLTKISPHILNISIPKIDNEFFVMQLDAKGICCSTKSSCLRDEDESYVLKSIGVDSRRSIRFSFGRFTTMGDLEKVVGVIKEILPKENKVKIVRF